MMDRRSFLRKLLSALVLSTGALGGFLRALPAKAREVAEPAGALRGDHRAAEAWYGELRATEAETGQPILVGFRKYPEFVEMETADAAQAAIQALNSRDLGGRPLTVNEARPKTNGGGGGGYGGGRGSRRSEPRW